VARDTIARTVAPGGADGLLERTAELAAVDWLVSAADDGPAALVLDGEAGIGKTALWEHGIARGLRCGHEVLCVRVRPADAALPFLGLAELLDPIADGVLCSLSPPLAAALEVLVFREPQAAPSERRTVLTAVARALTAQAAQKTTIVAIDDLQWLDSDSTDALQFAIHRLGRARVGLLFARRADPGEPVPFELDRALPDSRLFQTRLEPLTLRALRQLLHSRADLSAARSEAVRIHQVSAGNPLYAIEIARMIASGLVRPQPGHPLPLPADIRGVVKQRLARLPAASRLPLIAAAVMARPTVQAVAAATDTGPALWVDAGVRAGLLKVAQGRLAFTHPLFAAGVIELALPEELRALHARIASIVGDPEEHAVHLAQSSFPPDDTAAAALAESARLASRRGARLAAAERFHQAVTFTPPSDAAKRVRLSVEAAEAYRDAGNMERAITVATQALEDAPAGPERAQLLLAMATTEAMPDVSAVLREAAEHAGPDDALRARILNYSGQSEWLDGDLAAAANKFRVAASLAAAAGDTEAELQALGLAGVVGTLLAEPDAADLLHRAQALESAGQPVGPWYSPRHWLAVRAMWHDDLAAAIPGLQAEYLRAEQEGNEFDQYGLTFHLAHAELRAGSLAAAARYADIGYELAAQIAGDQNLGMSCAARTLTLACAGDAPGARAVASEGIAAARAAQDRFFEVHLRSAVAFLEVSLGNYAEAADITAGLPEMVAAMEVREPGIFPFAPDRIEALAALGILDEARAMTSEWEARGTELGRPRVLATAARCRALCHAAAADLGAAQAAAVHALTEHQQFQAPLELGRTLLVYGQILRRLKKKSEARAVLEHAKSVFAEVGAPLWVGRAQAELSRIGGRAPSPLDLTASERKVAEVVAVGATNREVADQLFLSVSTVEATLSRVYRKLGVRSRTEMASIVREMRS
jgi:DNA-binding CsgD family transcriptional regulator/tetratricopeptide (TPR) repeat protein